ncbi:hypothetical protein [[Mycoplasma] anseris]|uniref:Uncharacterized protein n=1 Tax=[Mycoplasma] anseris TaxID=92400 RepID=A0A2Z4NCH3_9BACT|nr:hypothetical protein [[Mycoplasma] anseris]AWX69196.1 hypothetical protein DP065_00250 [[Mycoplasma] anseris]
MIKTKILEIIKSIQNKYPNVIIQGSFVFYLKNYIKRVPNDVDLLFTNVSLKSKNYFFQKIKKQYTNSTVFDTECKSHFKIYYSSINEPIIIESILAKTIKKKYIENYGGIKITNNEYLVSSKICQILSNYYLYAYLNKKSRLEKIKNAINDLCYVLKKHKKILKSLNFALIYDNILMNLYYDLLTTKYHYVNYLKDSKFENFLKQINSKNSLQILFILKNMKINNKKIELINKIFETRDYFMDKILYKFQILQKFRFDNNYGLTFYIKNDLLVSNELVKFIRMMFKEYEINFHNSVIAKWINQILEYKENTIAFNFFCLINILLKYGK